MYQLLGLIALGFPVAVVVLIVAAVRQSRTSRQIQADLRTLVDRIAVLERGTRDAARSAEMPPVASTVIVPAKAEPVAESPVEAPPMPEPVQFEPVLEEPGPAEPAPVPSEPPKRFDWERFIGLRLPVWLGAIALSVAGFFFVSYAIESGFFTPEMRVLSAAAAALAFLAAAEFVRRRLRSGNVAALASALAAASIATAYATAYLATKTYGLVPSGAGFIATTGVSAIAIAIALAYGEVVALVGIVGGFVAPLIYGGGEANAAFLAIYVTALTGVSFTVIRLKSWWRLSIVGLVGPALWGLIWAATPALRDDAFWGDFYLIVLPAIVAIATWPGWRDDGPIIGLRGFTAAITPMRGALVGAVILAALGFLVFLFDAPGRMIQLDDGSLVRATGLNIGHWQGFIIYAALAVGLGFISSPHRALQLPILISAAVGVMLWTISDQTTAFIVTALFAIVFGFGALDQFRRLREPGFWASVFAFVAVFFYAVALFRVAGWGEVQVHKHRWALGALATAAALVGLLRYYTPRLDDETQRSQVYAAWGGAVTTLVSLAVVLELDPLYFPAASALAILGLSAVHLRAPVRGLRILAGVYLAIYCLLILGAFGYSDYAPSYYPYVFAAAVWDHALTLLIVPGLALLAAGTLFQMGRPTETRTLVTVMDIAGMVVGVIGLFYQLAWSHVGAPWSETIVLAARIMAPELAVAAAAVYLGRRFDRPAAYSGGIILTGLVALAMTGALLGPLTIFWPPFAVPGTIVFNITLLAYALPAALLFFIGWHLRHDARRGVSLYGIVVWLFAVLVSYAMVLVDIRQAWHLGQPTLAGDTSQSEFYAYSIATLVFGLGLLIGGVALKHRGSRAVSFVFVLAATIKVFLFDAAELDGLWRVLSFLLMGLSFLGISWAYARFVFGIGVRRSMPGPQSPSPPA